MCVVCKGSHAGRKSNRVRYNRAILKPIGLPSIVQVHELIPELSKTHRLEIIDRLPNETFA